MNKNDLVISTQGLSKSYGDIHALQSLDLQVPKNSIFGFLGPNGAGKTTTIKLGWRSQSIARVLVRRLSS
jgi:ABC-type multidrug transport system ATPase subunit